jgi:glycyl-tRNA synthetase
LLKEAGYRYDVVDAVMAEQSADPAAAAEAVKQLQAWVERPDWHTILPAFARIVRIIRSAPVTSDAQHAFSSQPPTVSKELLVEKEEKNLYKAVRSSFQDQPSDVDEFLNLIVKLVPSINTFFDKVLVMAEEEKIRRNRLALIGQIARLSNGLADLSKLEGF